MWILSVIYNTTTAVGAITPMSHMLYSGEDKPIVSGYPDEYDPMYAFDAGEETFYINSEYAIGINIEKIEKAVASE